jgi:transcriptional regulator with XRE-family HTH domain
MNKQKMGDFLTSLRKEKGLTQQDAADVFCVTPQAISKWESSQSIPDIEMLEKLSEFYHVTIEEILAGERKPKEEKKEEPEGTDDGGAAPFTPTPAYHADRSLGFGTFIFSMGYLVLFLCYYCIPGVYIKVVMSYNGYVDTITGFQTFFMAVKDGNVWAIIPLILAIVSSLLSLGVWLCPLDKEKKAFFWSRAILSYLTLPFLIVGMATEENGYSFLAWACLILLEIAYIVLIHTLPFNRLKNISLGK